MHNVKKTPLQIVYEEVPLEIKKQISQMNPRDFDHMSVSEIRDYIRGTRGGHVDVRELTKSENPYKFTQQKERGVLNITDDKKKSMPTDVKLLCKINNKLQSIVTYDSITFPRRYVLLDTRNRNPAYEEYTWNLVEISAARPGEVNSRDTVQQIIEVSCAPFSVPYQPLFYDSIRMGIREFDTQGVEIAACEKFNTHNYYHFEFDITQVGNRWRLVPKNTWRPATVLAQCSTLTLVFYGNSEKMVFPPDRITASVTPGTPAVLTSPANHGLSTGDLVYITQGNLYNTVGYQVVVVSPTTFTVDATATLAESVTVIIAARRIQVPLTFTCLEK